jgi:hypothetical protein
VTARTATACGSTCHPKGPLFGFAANPARRADARRAVRPMPLSEAILLAAAGERTLIDVRDICGIRATGRTRGPCMRPCSALPTRATPTASTPPIRPSPWRFGVFRDQLESVGFPSGVISDSC